METTTEHVRLTDIPRYILRSRTYEHFAPFGWGVGAGLVVIGFGLCFPDDKAIFSSSITTGSIVFGFLSTAMVLLIALDNDRMHRFRDSGYITDLVQYLREACYLGIGFVALNLMGYFLQSPSTGYLASWLGVAVALFLAFRRVLRAMIFLLRK